MGKTRRRKKSSSKPLDPDSIPIPWERALGGVFIAALALRLCYFFGKSGNPYLQVILGDALYFDKWALSIANGDTIVPGVFYMSPLYPYLVALIYKIAGHAPDVVKFLQHILGAGNCVLLAMIGQRVFGKRIGLLAGVMMAGYGLIIFYEGFLLKPTLGIFLIYTSILLLLEAQNRAEPKWIYPAGIALGLSALVRGNVYLLMPPLALWVACVFTAKKRWLAAALLVVGVCSVIFPVTIRNYVVGREFILSTSMGGMNFYLGNNPIATGVYRPLSFGRGGADFEEIDGARLAKEKTGKAHMTPGEISRFWFAEGSHFIRNNPGRFASLIGKKLILALNAAEVPDVLDFSEVRKYSLPLRVPLLNFSVLGPLGLMGIFICLYERRRDPKSWLLLIFCFGTLFSVCVFFVFARYRLTMIPMFMIFAAAFLEWVHRQIKSRQWRSLQLACLAAPAALFTVHNGSVLPFGPGVSIANLGFALLREGKLDEAEILLKRVSEINTKEPVHHMALALIYKKRKDNDAAIKQYRLAAKYFMGSGNAGRAMEYSAHQNLVELLTARGDVASANLHTKWLKAHPLPKKTDF